MSKKKRNIDSLDYEAIETLEEIRRLKRNNKKALKEAERARRVMLPPELGKGHPHQDERHPARNGKKAQRDKLALRAYLG
jgi:hypothetical protein